MWDWFDEFQMTPLYIHRDKKSKSFENQVLATPDYAEENPFWSSFMARPK